MKKLAELRKNPMVCFLLLLFTAIGTIAFFIAFLVRTVSKMFDEKYFNVHFFDDDDDGAGTSPEVIVTEDEDEYLGI